MMKDKRNVSKLLILFFGIAVFLSSCRPVIDLDRPGDYADGVGVSGKINFPLEFKSFWSGMNHNYLYWDIDSTNWDRVYDTYRPKFEALGVMDIADGDTNPALQLATDYIKDMTKNLSDGHLGIIFWNNDIFQPAYARVEARPDYYEHDKEFGDARWSDPNDSFPGRYNNWFENVIEPYPDMSSTIYFPTTSDSISDPDESFRAATGHYSIGSGSGYILYFYFNAFSLSQHMNDPGYGPVIHKFMNDLTKDPAVKGVIFDLRGNTGGAANDISMILSPLLTKPLKIGETRTKNGPGRLDYTPWGPFTIQPAPEARVKNPNMPVVALVNEFSISCGEIAPLAIKEMPNGHVMGKKTYGATGPRFGNDNPIPLSGGPFKGGFLVKQATYAGYATRSAHGVNYEGIGVPVDEILPFGVSQWGQFTNGSSETSQTITVPTPTHSDPSAYTEYKTTKVSYTPGGPQRDPWFERAVEYIKSKQ